MVRVYGEYYERKYYCHIASCGGFCCILSVIVVVVLPFLLSFATNRFWTKTSSYFEQPLVKFDGGVYLGLVTTAGTKHFCSVRRVNQLFAGQWLAPIIESTNEDADNDGLYDTLTFRAKVPVSTSTIRQVNILVGVTYELLDIGKSEIYSGVFASVSSAYGISSVKMVGDLSLSQRDPLHPSRARRQLYASESLFSQLEGSTFMELQDSHSSRNQSVVFNQIPVVMSYGNDTQLEIEMTMEVPKQRVVYQPEMLEVLKFAWLQYMSLFLPVYYIIYHWLMWVLYHHGVITAKVVEDPFIKSIERGSSH